MLRRILAIAAAAGALFGVAATVASDSPVKAAAPVQIVSPAYADLARVCVIVRQTNGGLCLHL